jgi:predicted amidohydrolase
MVRDLYLLLDQLRYQSLYRFTALMYMCRGTVVACASDKHPALVLADLDLSYVEQVRQSIPVATHRQPHIYGEILTARDSK